MEDRTVVAIGSHPDDIEIGVGGAVCCHRSADHEVAFIVMTAGERGSAEPTVRKEETIEGAAVLGVEDVRFLDYEDTNVPYTGTVVGDIEAELRAIDPDRVYLPTEADKHQDHRKTSLAGVAAARAVDEVYAYEGPSSRPSFTPEHFIAFPKEVLERKIRSIRAHESQVRRGIAEAEAMRGLARFRGQQANATYAESFQVIRSTERIGTATRLV